MANVPDSAGPTTSYSDPIYDRLETLSQRVVRRLGFLIAALIVIVVVAVIVHSRMQESPAAASVYAFQKAGEERDPAKREAAYTTLASDEQITPFFRARAYIELTQAALAKPDAAAAKAAAAKAVEWAQKADDQDIELVAGLSQAATTLDAGDFPAAESAYLKLERKAGSKAQDRQIAAILGAAKAQEKQNKIDDAIAKLETVISRSDAGARQLIDLARQEYWRLKRQQAGPALAAPAAGAPTAGAPVTAA
ncbi:MAG: hypothetical protein H0X38_14390, partial [Planctomycetes bacterium]|nr:hypothetical protein [Planctomycetota bacterium]